MLFDIYILEHHYIYIWSRPVQDYCHVQPFRAAPSTVADTLCTTFIFNNHAIISNWAVNERAQNGVVYRAKRICRLHIVEGEFHSIAISQKAPSEASCIIYIRCVSLSNRVESLGFVACYIIIIGACVTTHVCSVCGVVNAECSLLHCSRRCDALRTQLNAMWRKRRISTATAASRLPCA